MAKVTTTKKDTITISMSTMIVKITDGTFEKTTNKHNKRTKSYQTQSNFCLNTTKFANKIKKR